MPFQFSELKKPSGEEAKHLWKPKQVHLLTEIWPWICLGFLKTLSESVQGFNLNMSDQKLYYVLYEIRPLNCDKHGWLILKS